MPYAFAHPLAVIPLHKAMGRASVPSALAIGSMIPDAWYLVPGLARHDSHGAFGIFLFCLPAGILAYLAFHLLFKLPLLALLPPGLAGRLRVFTVEALPKAPWTAVLASMIAGTLTHVAWDSFTHQGPHHQLLQHASTLLGTIILSWWLWRKLRSTTGSEGLQTLPAPSRAALAILLLAIPAAVFAGLLLPASSSPGFGIDDLRRFARAGGVMALSVMGVFAMAYCLAWRLRRHS